MKKEQCLSLWLALLLAAFLPGFSIRAQDAPADDDRTELSNDWYAVFRNGRKIGHAHEWVTRVPVEGGFAYETRTDEETEIRRGDSTLRTVSHTRLLEDSNGLLIEFEEQTLAGGLPRVVTGKVQGDHLSLSVVTGEGTNETTAPAPNGLCPWAVTRLIREGGFEKGTKHEFGIFMSGLATRNPQATLEIMGDEAVKIGDKDMNLHKARIMVDLAPGQDITVWLDDDASAWKQQMRSGTVVSELRKVSKEEAKAPNQEVDVMVQSTVPADKVIKRSRRLEKLVMLLEPLEDGAEVADIASDTWQKVERVDSGLKLSIRRAHPREDVSYQLPYKDDDMARYLKPTLWLETDDERVRALTEQAVGDERDALAVARRLELAVRRAITNKNYGMGMATAAEVARKRAGDCTEHAVLLAAMARVVGLPSRAVTGMVYAGPESGGFQFHMWTEVYTGEWIPLDAALFGHDATHISLVRIDLSDVDLLASGQAVGKFVGRVRARILEVSHGDGDND